jgi:hypothetical protein
METVPSHFVWDIYHVVLSEPEHIRNDAGYLFHPDMESEHIIWNIKQKFSLDDYHHAAIFTHPTT